MALRAKHPSVWRNAKSLGAHAAHAPHLLPHPFPPFVLSLCFHLPHSDPLQPRKCSLFGHVAAVGGGVEGILMLFSPLLQHKVMAHFILSPLFL